MHERFGYERETFSTEAVIAFAKRYRPPASPEEAVRQIPRFRRDPVVNPQDTAESSFWQIAGTLRDLGRRMGLSAQE